MKRTLVISACLLLSGTLAARPAPPPRPADTPIGELQRPAGLRISGTVTRVVGNTFILDDGTGAVIVDAGPPWWHQLAVREGERVTVVGEPGPYDFSAFSVTGADGVTVTLRSAVGPPPWAGGPRADRPGPPSPNRPRPPFPGPPD